MGVRVRQREKTSMQNTSPKSRKHAWLEEAALLPAHAVAAGSPHEPGGTVAWKVDCRSKRSLCIFTALQRRRGRVQKIKNNPSINKQPYATN